MMAPEITTRGKMLVQIVREAWSQGGAPPTIREIATALHCSAADVRSELRRLTRSGVMRSVGGTAVILSDGAELELTPERIAFAVWGTPAPQGSKRAIASAGGKVSLIESARGLHLWRDLIYLTSLEHRPQVPIAVPVTVELTFYLKAPRHPRHAIPYAPPDADKLARAALDALVQASLISDDGLVSDLVVRRRFAPDARPGAEIVIVPWKETP